MTNAIIALKGDYLGKTTEIFECFEYNDLKQDKVFDSAGKMNKYLLDSYRKFTGNDISIRGIWVDNGWTIISDPEMIDIEDENALLKLSGKLNLDVLTFTIQTNSGTFAFARYNKTNQRYFSFIDGEITDDTGIPTKEEQGLNINKSIFADDILRLAANYGIDMEAKNVTTFTVKQLAYNEKLKAELEKISLDREGQQAGGNKPWWKIW